MRVQETYRSVDSRMAQESLRRYVLRVLRVWRSWFIFSDDFLNGLQAREARRPVTTSASSAGCAHARRVWSWIRSARWHRLSPLDMLCAKPIHEAEIAFTVLSLQATLHLRGPVAGVGEEDASLAAELEALPDEELEMRCRRSGLSKRGGRAAQISRCGALTQRRLTGAL